MLNLLVLVIMVVPKIVLMFMLVLFVNILLVFIFVLFSVGETTPR
jgi:hypothetical protein